MIYSKTNCWYLKVGKPTVIGRAPASDIMLNDRFVSYEHAEILSVGENFVINDLNSTNGLFVNGKRLERTILNNNDQILVGKTRLWFSTNQTVLVQSVRDRLHIFVIKYQKIINILFLLLPIVTALEIAQINLVRTIWEALVSILT